jgi:hypothetical protein
MSRPALAHVFDHSPLRFPGVEIILRDDDSDAPDEGDAVWAKVQVIAFETDGSIRDIIEQSVRLAPHPNLLADRERVAACMAAHVEVLGEVFARPRRNDWSWMPTDILHVDGLLRLRKAASREQFVAALRAHKRLGQLLVES